MTIEWKRDLEIIWVKTRNLSGLIPSIFFLMPEICFMLVLAAYFVYRSSALDVIACFIEPLEN